MSDNLTMPVEKVTWFVKEIDLRFTLDDINAQRVIVVETPKDSMFLSFCWNESGKLVIHMLCPLKRPDVQYRYIVLCRGLCVPKKMIVEHVASCGAHRHVDNHNSWGYVPLHLFRVFKTWGENDE